MTTYLSAGFVGREKLGTLLNKEKLLGEAVEIGTHRGYYADAFLEIWGGTKLYCVDPWSIPDGYEDQAKFLSGNGKDRDDDYKWAEGMAKRHAPRVELIREISTEAAKRFTDNSLDFVYLDGDHREEFVDIDLDVWYQKLKPEGILAGHDIICARYGVDDWGPGIRKAVNRFSAFYELNIHMIPEDGLHNWSYYMRKPL